MTPTLHNRVGLEQARVNQQTHTRSLEAMAAGPFRATTTITASAPGVLSFVQTVDRNPEFGHTTFGPNAMTASVTAVPEPSAFWCLGLIGVGLIGWNKLKKTNTK